MLNGTTELALRALILIGLEGDGTPLPPRRLAGPLECSPTYLGKTLALLARAGILRSVRGAHGGVVLAMEPHQVTLLAVVEACQGVLAADYCTGNVAHDELTCAFHAVMREVHDGLVATLSKWSLADLLWQPFGHDGEQLVENCKMRFVGCDRHVGPRQVGR